MLTSIFNVIKMNVPRFVTVHEGNISVNEPFKGTHHHVPGFFFPYGVPLDHTNIEQVFLGTRCYTVANDLVLNWSYDGQDVVGAPQRCITGEINHGELLYADKELKEVVSMITNYIELNGNRLNPIFTGFNTDSFMFSNVVRVDIDDKNASLPMSYASQDFKSKTLLANFVKESQAGLHPSPRVLRILRSPKATQLLLYENNINIINLHYRMPSV